jgi:hypothetical protein
MVGYLGHVKRKGRYRKAAAALSAARTSAPGIVRLTYEQCLSTGSRPVPKLPVQRKAQSFLANRHGGTLAP